MSSINSFKIGIRDGLPICFGYISVSFAFGLFATARGLSVLEAVMISIFNLTSAGQLAAVPIIVAGGGLFELIATQIVINLRYALMSVSLSQKMDKTMRARDRLVVAFANTDEVFAVASSREADLGRRYMYGLVIPPFFGWTIGTLLGALAGNVLPSSLVSALGIAIYAMFIAIVVPVVRESKGVAFCSAIAILISIAFFYIPTLSSVPSGFVIIIAAVISAGALAVIAPIGEKEDVDNV